MFKKILVFVLSAIMTLGVGTTVFANEGENNTIDDNLAMSQNELYLSTSVVPEEVINYAINNVHDYLIARSDVDTLDLNSISMGNPFTMTKENNTDDNLYYFPVFLNDTITYTFRVYMSENNEYVGILSPYMAKELNNYINRTDIMNPLSIYIDNGNIMAVQNGLVEILEEDHLNREPINIMPANRLQSNTVIDVLEPIKFDIAPMTRASASHSLTLDMKEKQGSKPWCAACASSSILRYKGAGSSVTAEAMMKATFPNSGNLDNENISRSQIVTYAKGKGYKNTTESSSTLTNTTVVSEISTNSTPIYAGCAGKGDYVKQRHALVICGYNNTSSTYTVWNPWYDYTETMSQSTKSYSVNSSSSFTWDTTIYKFRK